MHTNGNGYACDNDKFRLVTVMGSALISIANCIEHSSGYLRIREYFSLFLCHKCEYSVIAGALPSFEEEKKTNTLQLKVSSYTPEVFMSTLIISVNDEGWLLYTSLKEEILLEHIVFD